MLFTYSEPHFSYLTAIHLLSCLVSLLIASKWSFQLPIDKFFILRLILYSCLYSFLSSFTRPFMAAVSHLMQVQLLLKSGLSLSLISLHSVSLPFFPFHIRCLLDKLSVTVSLTVTASFAKFKIYVYLYSFSVSLLRGLKHNNIVTLHDIIHTGNSLTFVFEYLKRDLKQYMDDCNGLLSLTNIKVSHRNSLIKLKTIWQSILTSFHFVISFFILLFITVVPVSIVTWSFLLS